MRQSGKGGEAGESVIRRNLQSLSNSMNFNWKDNLSKGLGQRLYYSLPPPSSATLLFRMIQPPAREKQSNGPRNPPHTATAKSLSASATFWIVTDRATPPPPEITLCSAIIPFVLRKRKRTLKPSDDYFVWPIAIKKISKFLVASFFLTLSASLHFGLIKARLKRKQASGLASLGEIHPSCYCSEKTHALNGKHAMSALSRLSPSQAEPLASLLKLVGGVLQTPEVWVLPCSFVARHRKSRRRRRSEREMRMQISCRGKPEKWVVAALRIFLPSQVPQSTQSIMNEPRGDSVAEKKGKQMKKSGILNLLQLILA